jgi:hypothetical protein
MSLGLTEDDLLGISAQLRTSRPALPAEWVDVAVRDAVDILSGLATERHHAVTVIRQRAEASLDRFEPGTRAATAS